MGCSHLAGASTTPTPQFASAHEQQTTPVLVFPGPNLPLTVDPLLATGSPTQPVARRTLGESLDQRIQVQSSNFVVTVDSKHIFSCAYPDFSFRVIDTDNGRVRQVVYGHRNVVTILARSECNLFSDCFIASGSLDCTVLLWHWNAKTQLIAGEYNQTGELPSPRAVLTGHDSRITALQVSAEHGLVISASQEGAVLVHTTQGELLRTLAVPADLCDRTGRSLCPCHLVISRECFVLTCFAPGHMLLYTTSGRLLAQHNTNTQLNALCVSRDGEYVIGGSESGHVHVYRQFDLALLYTYKPCDNPIRSIAITQNHRFVLVGLTSGAIVVLNIDFNKWHYEYKNRYDKK